MHNIAPCTNISQKRPCNSHRYQQTCSKSSKTFINIWLWQVDTACK